MMAPSCWRRCCSSFGHSLMRWPRPPQNVHPPDNPYFSDGSSIAARNGGTRCLASRNSNFKSRRICSEQCWLINVVAMPVFPLRPVRPMRCTIPKSTSLEICKISKLKKIRSRETTAYRNLRFPLAYQN